MICCYILKSTISNRTYTGVTMDIERRLKQHNGELKGGAKSTRIGRPYKIHCIISGFENLSEAMKIEWKLKHDKKYIIDKEKYIILVYSDNG